MAKRAAAIGLALPACYAIAAMMEKAAHKHSSTSIRAMLLPVCLVLAACQESRPDGANESVNGAAAKERPALPLQQPALNRGALLFASMRAASAHAAGMDDTQAQQPLDGRRFELRMRFGCNGPSKPDQREALGWVFDAKRRMLRLRAAPTVSKNDPPIAGIVGTSFETVEGFWVDRPWLLMATCPLLPGPSQDEESATDGAPAGAATDKPAPAVALAPRHQLGVAQFYTAEDSRTHRRLGRPYQAAISLRDNEQPSALGYDLVLTGRLQRLPNGRVIACISENADAPPSCIVSVAYDRVRFERPDTKEVLAEWTGG